MITTILQGRLGNQFYQIAFLVAYAKKHNLEYYIPNVAYHCDGNKMYFPHIANGPELHGLQEYHEQPSHSVPKGDGTYHYNVPAYHDIPLMDNTKFIGYWQSFKYFDDYREEILEKFQLPYQKNGTIGIHCRFGDFTQLRDKHPEVTKEYYINAIRYFIKQGYRAFTVFSDDLPAAMEYFKWIDNWGYQITIWSSAASGIKTELEDLVLLSSCEHQILCYSTFGFVAAWLNRNPNKQIIIPPSRFTFGGANADMIPNYYKELEFE